MEVSTAVRALSALAHETRLSVYRVLVKAGPQGVAAGDLAAHLDVPSSTLSFHLQHLVHAGLVQSCREGRSIRYSLVDDVFEGLLDFLREDCCRGLDEPQCAAPAREQNGSES